MVSGVTTPPAPRLRTGPSGQVWDVEGHLKKESWYALVLVGPVSDEDKKRNPGELKEES